MTLIADLFDLQKVDYSVVKIRQSFEKVQKAANTNNELGTARKNVEDTEAELAKWEATQVDHELESQSLASRIAETDQQLMNGTVTNHKELEALQASLDSLKRQKDAIENRLVETLEQVEKLTSSLSQLRITRDALESEWSEKISELKGEGKKLQQQFHLLKQKRESLAQNLNKSALSLYEQLRKRKAGVAIAPLKGDTCGACNMQVPSGVISLARMSESEPVYCPSCGRILFAN